MLTFTIKGQKLQLEQIYYIDVMFVVAEHPETGVPCMFIREGEPTPYVALRRLGMRVSSPLKRYKGILYYELKENQDGEKKGIEDNLLPRGSGDKGMEGFIGGTVVS